jgi:LysR family glycine cleavage system transcriptional activator
MPVAPPRPKGPHLNALRAFESAARLGSFTSAADELGVTAGAIAQHIKSLEAWAEADLFTRHSRGVDLTALGEELSPDFTAAFDMMNEAVQSLRTKAAPHKIRIATLPSIAQLWLSEKLGRLRAIDADIVVSVMAVETPPNLAREPYDVSLFFRDGEAERDEVALFPDRIFPVCTPQIAGRLANFCDLANETLLHDSAWSDDWALWLASLAQAVRPGLRGPHHSLFSVALEEACNGAGVLMAHEALVQAKLSTRELVAPFGHKLSLDRRLIMRTTGRFRGGAAYKMLLTAMTDAG